MDELIADFLVETSDSLQILDNELVELENRPQDIELLNSIFRVMHTIKGTCGFFGMSKLASVAHAGENIMDKLRNKQLSVNSEIISSILEVVDVIKEIVSHIKDNQGTEPDKDYSSFIEKINNVAVAKDIIRVNSSEEVASYPEVESLDHLGPQSIKVSVELLEDMMEIVSELVLNRNQLIQLDRNIGDNRFSLSVQRLNTITTSLQEAIMKTRMQPISSAWVKLPRMLRDLSKELNKKIKLVMIGSDTELDRQLIESIKDPLVHMIRNAADHGIELPTDRLAAGKPEEGTITLNAYHQGGHIIIEVSDDGFGVRIKKVKNKILKNNLATEKELEEMSDMQVKQFIFKGGFSTAEVVTGVSGRGVGMDVVKNNIEDIRGTIELNSIEGKGSCFVIKIPLTLAIMPVLVVEACSKKFGIPQINVVEIVRTEDGSEHMIEEINGNKVLRLRDALLPLVTLSEVLKLSNAVLDQYFIIVCDINDFHLGIVVENVYNIEEIVLKPLPKLLRALPVYSGNTLLGNGDIIMILDPSGVAQYKTTLDLYEGSEDEKLKRQFYKSFGYLAVKCGEASKAISLELITRLEEIDVSRIELSNGRPVVQYYGDLMYLCAFDDQYKIPSSGIQKIVVFGDECQTIGLMVDDIIDIIEQEVDSKAIDENDDGPIVLNGKVMDKIEVYKIFEGLFFSKKFMNSKLPLNVKHNILLVNNSAFFRKMMLESLKEKGFEVLGAKDAAEALEILRDKSKRVDLVITDINMPEMDGFQFAKICKEDPELRKIPIMALTFGNDVIDNVEELETHGIKASISWSNNEELMPLILSLLSIKEV
jgi:two-component system chemotaxis sensor kinase CheA